MLERSGERTREANFQHSSLRPHACSRNTVAQQLRRDQGYTSDGHQAQQGWNCKSGQRLWTKLIVQFFFFATVNIISACLCTLLPETKGVSLEEMDVIFGSVTREERDAEIAARAHELHIEEKVAQPEHVERAADKV